MQETIRFLKPGRRHLPLRQPVAVEGNPDHVAGRVIRVAPDVLADAKNDRSRDADELVAGGIKTGVTASSGPRKSTRTPFLISLLVISARSQSHLWLSHSADRSGPRLWGMSLGTR